MEGQEITLRQLDEWMKEEIYRQQVLSQGDGKVYEMRREAVKQMLQERILEAKAAKQGISTDALVEAEAASMGAVSDEEVRAYYDENKARIPEDQTFESLAPRIRAYLEDTRLEMAARNLASLDDAVISLEPPRAQVAASGPSMGPADATVTIIEFSDFQCPYCSQAVITMKQVVERYPTQVRYVYRHMPLDFHAQAKSAAVASICADEQSQFWEYHDLLFQNQSDLSPANLGKLAESLGLDREAFDRCFADPTTAAQVERDIGEARQAGITGTPAFFVNGVLVTGARPLNDFVEMIESELALATQTEAAAQTP